jgi:hypothetical protein
MDNNTEIKDSSLYLVLGDNRTLIMDNFTSKFPPDSKAKDNITYTLKWDNFTFPVIPKSVFDNVTDIEGNGKETVRLEAEIIFTHREHDITPTQGISFYSTTDGYMTFVPLFELRDIYGADNASITNRKYAGLTTEDYKGGDLWGRKAFLQWVMDDGKLIFNDISSIHGARYNNGLRSILGHKSHTSGVEIDIRYAMPIVGAGNTDNISKTYCTFMNNLTYTQDAPYGNYMLPASLIELSTNAKKEFDNKTMDNDNKTNLKKLKDWIKTNRSMMEYYYDLFSSDSNNNRSSSAKHPTIFYGDGFYLDDKSKGFHNILYKGTFHNNNKDIAGRWNNSTRSSIMLQNAHHDHWHITAPIGKPAKRDNDLCP